MDSITKKFAKLGCEYAPGQEGRQKADASSLRGGTLSGTPVDFSHGNVDAFEPIPGTLDTFTAGVREGASQAYTEYRGRKSLRQDMAAKLSVFSGAPVDADSELIITPGTQGALFLALGATVSGGESVAIVEPDYFANRKLVEFFDGRLVPIPMDYLGRDDCAGIDLDALEKAFQNGVRLFLFSNPNNPAGVVYSRAELCRIAELADSYHAVVIVDELYSRQVFDGRCYTHLRALGMKPENLMTIIGPSKTESLSGYRLGIAYGSALIIERMEKLQAIVSLRAGGYSQAVLKNWFEEPKGWMEDRIAAHQAIRDELIKLLEAVDGVKVRPTEAGSYLFPTLPPMTVSIQDFVQALRLQADVIVTPGTEFGPQFTGSFRINFSQDRKAAAEAVRRITLMIERYRK